jgi:hypothetical protein
MEQKMVAMKDALMAVMMD